MGSSAIASAITQSDPTVRKRAAACQPPWGADFVIRRIREIYPNPYERRPPLLAGLPSGRHDGHARSRSSTRSPARSRTRSSDGPIAESEKGPGGGRNGGCMEKEQGLNDFRAHEGHCNRA